MIDALLVHNADSISRFVVLLGLTENIFVIRKVNIKTLYVESMQIQKNYCVHKAILSGRFQ